MKSNKVLMWMLGVPLTLIGLVVLSYFYFEANKSYWDSQVRGLCGKDGGVTVYERVELTQEEYESNDGEDGVISVMPEGTSKSWHQYAWRNTNKVIKSGSPTIQRSEYTAYKKVDGKELGKWVIYSRGGGDFPTIISSPSGFSCRDIPEFERDMIEQIFNYEGEK
jgi:hypothetical protein